MDRRFMMGCRVRVVDGDEDIIPEGTTGKLVGVQISDAHRGVYAIIAWDDPFNAPAPDGWNFGRFEVIE